MLTMTPDVEWCSVYIFNVGNLWQLSRKYSGDADRNFHLIISHREEGADADNNVWTLFIQMRISDWLMFLIMFIGHKRHTGILFPKSTTSWDFDVVKISDLSVLSLCRFDSNYMYHTNNNQQSTLSGQKHDSLCDIWWWESFSGDNSWW